MTQACLPATGRRAAEVLTGGGGWVRSTFLLRIVIPANALGADTKHSIVSALPCRSGLKYHALSARTAGVGIARTLGKQQ